MALKIEWWTPAKEILRMVPSASAAMALKWLMVPPIEERTSFLDEAVISAAWNNDDEQTFALTNLMCAVIMEREVAVARDGTGNRFEKENAAKAVAEQKAWAYLEDLFWRLPDTGTAVLTRTKAFIFNRLLTEWKLAVPSEVSIRAFRRAIAMGWPLPADRKAVPGESEIELKARGRRVSEDERKQYLNILRERIGNWALADVRDVDNLFFPWFSLRAVPSDIQDMLAIARARLAGHRLALRDVVRAKMLNGLPESGVGLIASLADRMRLAMEALDRVKGIITKSVSAPQIPQYRSQRENIIAEQVERAFQYCFSFHETGALQVLVTMPNKVDGSDTYDITVGAIEQMQGEGVGLHDILITLRLYDQNDPKRIVKECALTSLWS